MKQHAWVTDVLDDIRTYLEMNDQPAVMAAVAYAGQIAEAEFRETEDDTSTAISPDPLDEGGRLVFLHTRG